MKTAQRRRLTAWGLVFAAAMVLGACNFPGSNAVQSDVFATAAAQTVAAQLTQAASQASDTPAATQPPADTATPTATVTPVPTTPAPTATTACTNAAQFVTDVTIPDGTNIAAGGNFNKTWRLKNAGTCTWDTSYALVFAGGSAMGGPASQPLAGSVPSGSQVDLTVSLTAPSAPGSYTGNWQLRTGSGALFGIGAAASGAFWVKITVGPTPTPTPGVFAAAHIALKQTFLADLDTGNIIVDSTSDMWFEAVSSVEMYLTPKNGAKFVIVTGVPSLTDCQGAALSTAQIPLASLPAGSWLCYQTNAGHYGRMQIDSYTMDGPSKVMNIDFRTWSS